MEIPDAVFEPIVQAVGEDEGLEAEAARKKEAHTVHGFDMSGYDEIQREQVAQFLNAKISSLEKVSRQKADFLYAKAEEESKAKAEKTVADAERQRDEIIKHAKMQAGEIFEKARQQGRKAGKQEKNDEIAAKLSQLEEAVSQMKAEQNRRFDAFSEEIKWIACDVASALVYKKIDEDEMFLKELVKAAVKEAKEAEWISVELSERFSKLVKELRKDYEGSEQKIDFEAVGNKDVGSVVINGSDRLVDASISKQLENIKEYFRSFEEFEENEM